MKKLLMKLTKKLCEYLATKIDMDFNKNERNDLLELADMLENKMKEGK